MVVIDNEGMIALLPKGAEGLLVQVGDESRLCPLTHSLATHWGECVAAISEGFSKTENSFVIDPNRKCLGVVAAQVVELEDGASKMTYAAARPLMLRFTSSVDKILEGCGMERRVQLIILPDDNCQVF